MRKMLMMYNSDLSVRLCGLACGQGSRSCAKAQRSLRRKVWIRTKILISNKWSQGGWVNAYGQPDCKMLVFSTTPLTLTSRRVHEEEQTAFTIVSIE